MHPDIILAIPYPPSVNTYWGFKGSRRFLTKKAVLFKEQVLVSFKLSNQVGFSNSRISLEISVFPPDKRVRDIDNILKPLLDALTQAGVFDDDGQVDSIHLVRGELFTGGKCIVKVSAI
jgi:crossover junction endodeoxyribonuclease RusA